MGFVVLGVLLLLAKVAEVGPVGEWSWWGVLSPFAGAIIWWAWADASGHTRRKQMRRQEERQRNRRDKALEALGVDHRRRR